jgi:LysM repeat protein
MNLSNKASIINIIKSCAAAIIIIGLNSCGSNGNIVKVSQTNGFQQNHGPFDSNGNYVESWADNPPIRKISWKPSIPVKPTINPIPKPSRNFFSSFVKATPAPKPNNITVARTAPPSQTYSNPAPTRTTYTPPKKTTPPIIVKKSTAKKITPKAKPPIIHIVKKGDTLSGLSRKYGATVKAIQSVNNIKGTNIVIGKKLTIPRK